MIFAIVIVKLTLWKQVLCTWKKFSLFYHPYYDAYWWPQFILTSLDIDMMVKSADMIQCCISFASLIAFLTLIKIKQNVFINFQYRNFVRLSHTNCRYLEMFSPAFMTLDARANNFLLMSNCILRFLDSARAIPFACHKPLIKEQAVRDYVREKILLPTGNHWLSKPPPRAFFTFPHRNT